MATRVYLPSSGAAAVTPSTFNFAAQINPLTFAGSLTKTSSAMTTKTEATGTTNPTARCMLRYVLGPLEAQTINGNIKGQMRGAESNAGANATLAIAVKIIQPGGADRAVLLAQTASDAATAGNELVVTTITNAQFKNVTETTPIPLSSQVATRGDYLVIEIGFRSATATTRNIDLRYGDTGATDLPEDTSTTADNVPWVEFSTNILFYKEPGLGALTLTGLAPALFFTVIGAMGAGALTLAGLAPTVSVATPISAGALTLTGLAPSMSTGINVPIPAGSLVLTGNNVRVAFQGPEIGAVAFTGQAPTISLGDAGTNIQVPAGSLTLTGQALIVTAGLIRDIPTGSLALTGANVRVAFQGPELGALTFQGHATEISISDGSGTPIPVPSGALVFQGLAPTLRFDAVLPVSAGALSFAGLAPTVSLSFNQAVPAGVLTFTGLAPAVTYQIVIAVPAGALTYEGRTPNTGGGLIIDPDKGALTFTGLAPSLALTFVANIAAGHIAFQGLAPSLAFTLPIQVGALTLNGLAPTVLEDRPIAIYAGTLALQGQAPSVLLDISSRPNAGALAFTGLAPSPGIDYVFEAPAGNLFLAGYAPTFVIAPSIVLDPETASMRILMARHTTRVTTERNRIRILMPRHTVKETEEP